MTDAPLAYWLDNTLYVYGNVLSDFYQVLGDITFLFILMCAELFALIGVLLWIVFTIRGSRF